MRYLAFGLALLLSSPIAAAEDSAPVDVMILGTYHFANPGRDAVNAKVDDVTQPARQEEIAALVAAIAEFKPDRVLIERQIDDPGMVDPGFADYRAQDLQTKHNENVQIGYRLAHLLGHDNVYGFDEQPGEGEPDYFPLGKVQKFAQANSRETDFGALFGAVQDRANRFEEKQKCASIPTLLLEENDRQEIAFWHSKLYYGLLSYGDHDNQAGADLNAYWYMRNAKMFAKIGLIAEPGERVFVLVGAGHKYWLDHFAATVPGFRPVDPRSFLEQAAAQLPPSPSCD